MYESLYNKVLSSQPQALTYYAESGDGVSWVKPSLGLVAGSNR